MAAIHTESAAVFGSKNVNVSEEKIIFVDYKPVNPITPHTVVEFVIPGHGGKYISLKDTRLHCEVEFRINSNGHKLYKPKKPITPLGYAGDARIRELPTNSRIRKEATDGDLPDIPPHPTPPPEVVNLNNIDDDDERRKITLQYEERVREWNNYVNSFIGGTYEYETTAFPIDAIFHTMWNGVDVFMNQQLVSTTNTMYAYKAYIETLLNNTASTKKYQLRNIGYTGPEGHFSPSQLMDSDANPYEESEAQERRKQIFKTNITYDLVGYLSSDMWNIQASIVNGVEIGLKLYPNKDAFRMMTFPQGVEATVVLKDITLKVCKKTMAPKIVLAHDQVLKKNLDATYPFTRTEVRSFNVGKGMRSATIENPYQSNIPSRLIVGMVRADAKAGSFSKDPLKFRHFDISSAGFYINDEPVPRRPFRLDPAQGRFIEPLVELYTTLGHTGGEDLGISHEEYVNGAFLLPFDVQPTAAGNLQYLARRTGGHCRLELLFKEPLPCNICVITYAIFPSILEIDHSRNVRVVDLEKPFRVAAMKGSVNKNQSAITTAPAA